MRQILKRYIARGRQSLNEQKLAMENESPATMFWELTPPKAIVTPKTATKPSKTRQMIERHLARGRELLNEDPEEILEKLAMENESPATMFWELTPPKAIVTPKKATKPSKTRQMIERHLARGRELLNEDPEEILEKLAMENESPAK